MKVRNVGTALLALMALTVTACGSSQSEPTGNRTGGGTAWLACLANPIEASVRAGGARGDIEAALEGDERAAWTTFSRFLAIPSLAPAEDETTCLTLFWGDIAAQNGSIQAAYEMATFGKSTPQLCHRSRFWAKQALARIDEFKGLMRADVAPADAEAEVELRRQQLNAALAKTCERTP